MLEGDGEKVGLDFRNQQVVGDDRSGAGGDTLIGDEDSSGMIKEMKLEATQVFFRQRYSIMCIVSIVRVMLIRSL